MKIMLLNFSVENFRIFRDRTTLSMEATPDNSHEDELLITPAVRSRVLRSAVIYGANASGKTKFLEAMELMRNFVMGSFGHMPNTRLNHTPFLYDKKCASKPTSFEADIVTDNVRYVYGFSYDHVRITEEHLIAYPSGKKKVIFERTGSDYRFPSNAKEQTMNAKKVRENVLYISVAAQFNHFESLEVYKWFMNGLFPVIQTSDEYLSDTLRLSRTNKKFEKLIIKALRIADFGISRVYDRNDRRKDTDPQASINSFVPEIPDIWVEHVVNGSRVEMPIMNESSGTRRFLSVIGPAISCLLDGRVMVIDEIDMSFHTDVCEWLVGLFNDPSENANGAQIIFNTHDVELMDLESIRRDQIWFTIKDWQNNEAQLRRLSDFKGVRKDLNIRKAYRNGSFGAKPFIEPERLME